MNKFKMSLLMGLMSSSAWGHANLVSPPPRSADTGLKVAPCGGKIRGATPTVVNGGRTLTVQWQETINHPGKFFLSLSMANDAGFEQNLLATVLDTKDATNDLPHVFTAQVQIPDVNCDTCTLQMIQSMEENPAAPTYYYSCADLKIVSSTGATPTPSSGNNSQSTNTTSTESTKKFGGGCGVVSEQRPNGRGGQGLMLSMAFLLPLLAGLYLRWRASGLVSAHTASQSK